MKDTIMVPSAMTRMAAHMGIWWVSLTARRAWPPTIEFTTDHPMQAMQFNITGMREVT